MTKNPDTPARIEVGGTYRTAMATWTVERIAADGMLHVRRDDGLTTTYGERDFAGWVVERLGAVGGHGTAPANPTGAP